MSDGSFVVGRVWSVLQWENYAAASSVRALAFEVVGQPAGLSREQVGAGVVTSLDGVPVVDLQGDIAPTQCHLLRLALEATLLLGQQLDLVSGGGRSRPPVGDVAAHIAHGHAGGSETGDPGELVEVVVVVDPVPAAGAAADRSDHPDGLVVAQSAGRQTGQRCRLPDGVRAMGGRGAHVNDRRN